VREREKYLVSRGSGSAARWNFGRSAHYIRRRTMGPVSPSSSLTHTHTGWPLVKINEREDDSFLALVTQFS
jgi:hypothetical protein